MALLATDKILGSASSIDYCVQLGDVLLAEARKSNAYWSWKPTAGHRGSNLTGFSHGVSGIGTALLEVFRLSGEARFRSGAEMAFHYERHWFDRAAGNWPDLRGRVTGRKGRHLLPCSGFWCHGAPGIALSRLRAWEITQDAQCLGEAKVALSTTQSLTHDALKAADMGFSLCHGLAGNAEVLVLGQGILGTQNPVDLNVVDRVVDAGIDTLSRSSRQAPTQSPGLMTGLAGLGHFLLRRARPEVPPLLLLTSECFTGKAEARV